MNWKELKWIGKNIKWFLNRVWHKQLALKWAAWILTKQSHQTAWSGGWGKNLIRLNSCLSDETGWSTAEINKVINALELSDAWAHIELAKNEQVLSKSRLAAWDERLASCCDGGLLVVAGRVPVFAVFGRLWLMLWEFKAWTEIKLNRLLWDRSEVSRRIRDDSKMGGLQVTFTVVYGYILMESESFSGSIGTPSISSSIVFPGSTWTFCLWARRCICTYTCGWNRS